MLLSIATQIHFLPCMSPFLFGKILTKERQTSQENFYSLHSLRASISFPDPTLSESHSFRRCIHPKRISESFVRTTNRLSHEHAVLHPGFYFLLGRRIDPGRMLESLCLDDSWIGWVCRTASNNSKNNTFVGHSGDQAERWLIVEIY